jgi:hypothetical protein
MPGQGRRAQVPQSQTSFDQVVLDGLLMLIEKI